MIVSKRRKILELLAGSFPNGFTSAAIARRTELLPRDVSRTASQMVGRDDVISAIKIPGKYTEYLMSQEQVDRFLFKRVTTVRARLVVERINIQSRLKFLRMVSERPAFAEFAVLQDIIKDYEHANLCVECEHGD